MNVKHEYTPEKPLTFRCEDEAHRAKLADELSIYLLTGGVKVWHDQEISSRAGGRVWVTASTEEGKPDWRAGEPVVIADSNCIKLIVAQPAPLVARRYLDLELFNLAAEKVGVRVQVEVELGHGVPPPDLHCVDADNVLGFLQAERLLGNHPQLVALVIYYSRYPVAEWGGAEDYEARLPIVPFEDGDAFHGPGQPAGLAAWLVRVDESALDTKLVNHPDEPEVVEGYRRLDGKFWSEGAIESSDEILVVDDWTHGYEVDGEFVEEDDYENLSLYSPPDDNFWHEEMASWLRRVLDIGAQRRFFPCEAKPAWRHIHSGAIRGGVELEITSAERVEDWKKGVFAMEEFFPANAAAPAGGWKIVNKWGEEL